MKYSAAPFEARKRGQRKAVLPSHGECIEAELTRSFPQQGSGRRAWLTASPAAALPLPPASLDGVFTDPPYFDNVQYAELMDFCYVWLRLGLAAELPQFHVDTTRSPEEP